MSSFVTFSTSTVYCLGVVLSVFCDTAHCSWLYLFVCVLPCVLPKITYVLFCCVLPRRVPVHIFYIWSSCWIFFEVAVGNNNGFLHFYANNMPWQFALLPGVIEQYTRFVKPAFDQFIGPSRRYADIIIPWQRGDNIVAIDLITEHIKLKLKQHDLLRIHPNLEVGVVLRCMHAICCLYAARRW